MGQDALTRFARDKDCQIRLPGICNFNRETTVPCHFRVIGYSGMAFKVPSFLIALGCSACHAVVDSDKDPAIQLAFAIGVMRTQVLMFQYRLILCPKLPPPDVLPKIFRREELTNG